MLENIAALPLRVLGFLLAVAVVLLVGYLALTLTDHDPGGFLTFVVTLAGLVGLGGHQAKTARTIAKIDHQTNGVLTKRIEDGASAAVRTALIEAGIRVEPHRPVS